jgi:hypothetical protein
MDIGRHVMRIVIGALIVLVAAIAIILIAAATRPDTFRVSRSIVIHAGPEKIAEQIVDFRKWTSWSPYEKKDPDMKRAYTGPAAGVGAAYEWKGNSEVGSGRLEITDVSRSRITIKFDFFGPIEGHNIIEYLFELEGGATKVTWDMRGPSPFIGKLLGLFINMDGMVGNDF